MSCVIVLPTTLYGELVVAPMALSPAIGPSAYAGAVPQLMAEMSTFTSAHASAGARSPSGGAAASVVAFAVTAATCEPAAGVVPPDARVSDRPVTT